jgi:hypothetical protein
MVISEDRLAEGARRRHAHIVVPHGLAAALG